MAVTSDTRSGARPSVEERRAQGRAVRKEVPRRSLGEWSAPARRPDPVGLLLEQEEDRLPWLVPVRHARMMASPFAFYRGAARVMAVDLASRPNTGLTVQICGDAHLSNFGTYASPERRLVFDVNDFDETLAGPWEWDVDRLAASLVIAGRHRGLDHDACASAATTAARAYREAMQSFAPMQTLDVWYQRLDVDELANLQEWSSKAVKRRVGEFEARARRRDNLQALKKLAVEVDGDYRIRSDPPLLVPLSELGEQLAEDLWAAADQVFRGFAATLPDDRRALLDRFHLVDAALKVVGVGSVGTRCFILLLEGNDRSDPLFLQIKEATASVFEDLLAPSPYDHSGRRVVEGQRLLQAVSDIFLGWTDGPAGRHFYVRQLRDWKGSVDLETAPPGLLGRYAELCGWTLARGHARSGDAVAIASYLGSGTTFDEAVSRFAVTYADQNEADYEAFLAAIDAGRVQVAPSGEPTDADYATLAPSGADATTTPGA